jgi:hypothetical protein
MNRITLVKKGGPKLFLPDPGAVGVNETSCGQCRSGYGDRLEKSLMNTEAGKLQGNLWSWGLQDNKKSVYGNYTLNDTDGIVPSVGSNAYKQYIKAYAQAHPDQVPTNIKQIPQVSPDEVMKHPNKADITYSRQQCQRCHVSVSGREKRGDYRGAGCSSCHLPYSNEGLYEGGDKAIDASQKEESKRASTGTACRLGVRVQCMSTDVPIPGLHMRPVPPAITGASVSE